VHDVLTNLESLSISCLDHGHVRLVDCSPRLVPEETKTADFAICQAARVSYGDGTKSVSEDRGLIRYLLRHAHTTPFEMVEFKFHCKMPIFVARQWIRHRTASVNEVSGRYSVVKDECYVPELENIHAQATTNKQGRAGIMPEDAAADFRYNCVAYAHEAFEDYAQHIEKGVARELARINLPLSTYTEWYWKIDLHNLLHFLALRCDSHAQYEIRVFAEAMLQLIQPIVPLSVEAWNDYHPMRGAKKFSRLELEALAKMLWQKQEFVPLDCDNKREQDEWQTKVNALRVLGQYQEDAEL
jgi:thymidylate synthase (FAD)